MNSNAAFALSPIRGKSVRMDGPVGELARNISRRWLTDLRQTNPALLDMFLDTEHSPHRYLLAWSGEFAGKYLTGAVQIYRITGDKELLSALECFVKELLECQRDNGYLGPFPEVFQLTGAAAPAKFCFDEGMEPQNFDTWDSWGHYHIMYGLLHWYDLTGDEAAFSAVTRIADLFVSRFYGEGQPRLVDTRSEEMNLAVVHAFAILYQMTGEKAHLTFAERVLEDFSVPPAGDYLRLALTGQEFYQMPKPRWESLHAIQGILELYAATGNGDYRQAFEHLWWSITSTDVHNTGGFSTWEQAKGTPYAEGPVETCCTIAYMAATVDMLRLTGLSVVADVLELSTLNGGLGSLSPSGRWSTYDTPMEGYKRANYDSIHFQCRPGSPDLNCCSVNAPRALGMLDDWAYMYADRAVTVNYYGPGRADLSLGEEHFIFEQETGYPYDGRVLLRVLDAPAGALTLRLRVPFWSAETRLWLNGEALPAPTPGGYHELRRVFLAGDTLELVLDMSLHIWAGEERLEGRGSLYHGPLALCADPFFDPALDVEHLPTLDPCSLQVTAVKRHDWAGGIFTLRHGTEEITLCDLYTAGLSGTPYTTWLPMSGLTPQAFCRENPFRTRRYGAGEGGPA